MKRIHDVFHVSQLKKYNPDSKRVMSYQPLQLQEDLTYVKECVQIMDRKIKKTEKQVHSIGEGVMEESASRRYHLGT